MTVTLKVNTMEYKIAAIFLTTPKQRGCYMYSNFH